MADITLEMIERYREEYGIEPIDETRDYKNILVTGAVLATDPELTENYKKLNSIMTCDGYYLRIHSPLATMKFKGTDEEKYVNNVAFSKEGNIGFKEGQEILIYYNSSPESVIPGQIIDVGKIEIVKEQSDTTIPDEINQMFQETENTIENQ